LEDDYFQMEFTGENDATKQPQRERVLNFILKHHPDTETLRYFGFPAAWWKFEDMLLDKWKRDIRLIGIERDPQVIDYGIRFMPGRNKQFYRWNVNNGAIDGYVSTTAYWIHFRAEQFFGTQWAFRSQNGTRNKHYRKTWARRFKNWTCAWIDPFSILRGTWLESLPRIGMHFDPRFESLPLAFSFPIGRDECPAGEGEETLDSRVRCVTNALSESKFRTFEPLESFEHRRAVGCMTVGTVMGLMHSKPDAPVPPWIK
jgi:hypothetical protein